MTSMIKYRIGMGLVLLCGAGLLFSVLDLFPDKSLDYHIFRSEHGWGYDIVCNGQRVIHQPNIPAVSGNRAFPTRQSAVHTAHRVMEKISRGEFPTLSRMEIDSLLGLDR